MRLPFEEPDEQLALVPMAGRRALDHAGLKLSLEGWRSLALEARREIAEIGAVDLVDVERTRELCALATPAAAAISPALDPASMPEVLRGRIDQARWSALSAIERYAIASYARRGRDERLATVLAMLIAR